MIQLNLLPDIKKEFINAQKTKGMVISVSILVTLGALGLSALLFVYVTFIQQIQIGLTDGDIKRKTGELQSIQDLDKYLTIQNQLKSLPQLHDEKGVYSRMFTFLPVLNPNVPNNITLTSLQTSSEEHTILFNGTSKSFEAFNIFVDTLQNAEVSYKESGAADAEQKKERMFETVQVETTALSKSGNETVVNFAIRGTYKEVVFSAKSYDVHVSVPSIQTTQSVTDSPRPTQLFNGASGAPQ